MIVYGSKVWDAWYFSRVKFFGDRVLDCESADTWVMQEDPRWSITHPTLTSTTVDRETCSLLQYLTDLRAVV